MFFMTLLRPDQKKLLMIHKKFLIELNPKGCELMWGTVIGLISCFI